MRINPGTIVTHFKRDFVPIDELERDPGLYMYKYIGPATHTETKEKLAVYMALYMDNDKGVEFGQIFVRPYDMFMGETDKTKYPNARQTYRFEKLK